MIIAGLAALSIFSFWRPMRQAIEESGITACLIIWRRRDEINENGAKWHDKWCRPLPLRSYSTKAGATPYVKSYEMIKEPSRTRLDFEHIVRLDATYAQMESNAEISISLREMKASSLSIRHFILVFVFADDMPLSSNTHALQSNFGKRIATNCRNISSGRTIMGSSRFA